MGTFITGFIVLAVVVGAIRKLYRDRKSGKTCGSCGGYCGSCCGCERK